MSQNITDEMLENILNGVEDAENLSPDSFLNYGETYFDLPFWAHSFPMIEAYPIIHYYDYFKYSEVENEVGKIVKILKSSNFDSVDIVERKESVLILISEVAKSVDILISIPGEKGICSQFEHQARIILENILLNVSLSKVKPKSTRDLIGLPAEYLSREVVLHDTTLRDFFQSVFGRFPPMRVFRELCRIIVKMDHPASIFQAGYGATEELNMRDDLVDSPVLPGRTFKILCEELSDGIKSVWKKAELPPDSIALEKLLKRFPVLQPYKEAESMMSKDELEEILSDFPELAPDTKLGRRIRNLYFKRISGLWRTLCATTLNPVASWAREDNIEYNRLACGFTDATVFDSDDRESVLVESSQQMKKRGVSVMFAPNLDSGASDALNQLARLVRASLTSGSSDSTHFKDASSHIPMHPEFIVESIAVALTEHQLAGVKRPVGFHAHNPSGRLEAANIYAILVAGPDQPIVIDACCVPDPSVIKGHALAQADIGSLSVIYANLGWLGDWSPSSRFEKGIEKLRREIHRLEYFQRDSENYIDFTTERRLMLAIKHLAGGWASVFTPKLTLVYKMSMLRRVLASEKKSLLNNDGKLNEKGLALRDQVYDMTCEMADQNRIPFDSRKRVTPAMNQTGDFGLGGSVSLFDEGLVSIKDGRLFCEIGGSRKEGFQKELLNNPEFLEDENILADCLLWSQSREVQETRPNINRDLARSAVNKILQRFSYCLPNNYTQLVEEAIPLSGKLNPLKMFEALGKARTVANLLGERTVDLEILELAIKCAKQNLNFKSRDQLLPFISNPRFLTREEYDLKHPETSFTKVSRMLSVCFPNSAGKLSSRPKTSMGLNSYLWLFDNWHDAKYDPSGKLQHVIWHNYGLDVDKPWPEELFGEEPPVEHCLKDVSSKVA